MLGSNTTARWDNPFPRTGCTLDVQIQCIKPASQRELRIGSWVENKHSGFCPQPELVLYVAGQLVAWSSFDNVATRGYIVPVKTVGIRELKNRLSEHLREVRRGEHLLITDRGEVIGELSPPGQSIAETSVPIGLLALARRGMLTLGNPGDRSPYPALPRTRRGKNDAASMLDAERGRR